MSAPRISDGLRAAVRARAHGCCEYCLLPDDVVFEAHEPDHIVAFQHGGESALENLAFACFECNRRKGPNIASIDPETGKVVPLFNPRTQNWSEHFRLIGQTIEPLSGAARATAALLQLNSIQRQTIRQMLQSIGRFRR